MEDEVMVSVHELQDLDLSEYTQHHNHGSDKEEESNCDGDMVRTPPFNNPSSVVGCEGSLNNERANSNIDILRIEMPHGSDIQAIFCSEMILESDGRNVNRYEAENLRRTVAYFTMITKVLNDSDERMKTDLNKNGWGIVNILKVVVVLGKKVEDLLKEKAYLLALVMRSEKGKKGIGKNN